MAPKQSARVRKVAKSVIGGLKGAPRNLRISWSWCKRDGVGESITFGPVFTPTELRLLAEFVVEKGKKK